MLFARDFFSILKLFSNLKWDVRGTFWNITEWLSYKPETNNILKFFVHKHFSKQVVLISLLAVFPKITQLTRYVVKKSIRLSRGILKNEKQLNISRTKNTMKFSRLNHWQIVSRWVEDILNICFEFYLNQYSHKVKGLIKVLIWNKFI